MFLQNPFSIKCFHKNLCLGLFEASSIQEKMHIEVRLPTWISQAPQ